jgi:thiamine-monophosphate kinase
MKEFELIQTYFQRPLESSASWVQGIGDDCAIWDPQPGYSVCVSTDILLEGRHFLPKTDPEGLGHKALAVNLSDLAACGAEPLGFTLGLALPRIDPVWLAGFSTGLLALAKTYRCPLVGGDTTQTLPQGPLTIAITIWGQVPHQQPLLRRGAQSGDDIYVTGHLGGAAWALGALKNQWTVPEEWFDGAKLRLERPQPRIAMGQALRAIATAAIDLSDGLHGDVQHLLKASKVGANIDLDALRRQALQPGLWEAGSTQAWSCALGGGDDYELLFTAPTMHRKKIEALGLSTHTPVTRIGSISSERGLRYDQGGQVIEPWWQSFEHFQEAQEADT